ncbi:hypothetical protein SAMN04487792_0565 [Lactobacillus bombicola]|uniref:Uncharacterized protein n=1 Tax=Lactobacillus bombicola TaxID=1505723 RepID=A0A1I1RT48_9LACO|nr:hypothetical protein [Lactobacillus bombicola]MCO6527419.1 hypothetical protein [Lactobacillus sp.]SFD37536.1 hypothetical protein SAMN04487792_0565 [Lactobacillus bombicola]
MNKKHTTCRLPHSPRYQVWSKQLLQERIEKDKVVEQYLIRTNTYLLNANTLAIYEFQQQPFLGIYKSVIFDCQEGIILCQQSSSTLITTFAQKALLGGLEFQRELADKLNLKGHNVIATGNLAYFSLQSYNSSNVDSIALHQISKFKFLNSATVIFKTINYNGHRYSFIFDKHSKYLFEKISNALFFNHVISKLLANHAAIYFGITLSKKRGPSLIDQSDYFHPHKAIGDLSLKSIISAVNQKRQLRYVHYLADEFEMPYLIEANKTVYYLSKRPDTLY